jgi:hypothetical protein
MTINIGIKDDHSTKMKQNDTKCRHMTQNAAILQKMTIKNDNKKKSKMTTNKNQK